MEEKVNILRPQKIIENDLTNIVDLLKEIKEDDNLENIKIENYKQENIELQKIFFPKKFTLGLKK